MTSLRRRGELLPILPLRELESDNVTDPFLVLYVSPCKDRVSNDPLDPSYEAIPCNISKFDCFLERGVSSTNTTGISVMVVSFQYELWTKLGADFNESLQALEGAMLQHVAAITGLDTCAEANPIANSTRRIQSEATEQIDDQPFSSQQMGYFLGVDSAPIDMVDDNYDECIVPVQASSSADSVCQPMIGSVTALIDADLDKDSSLEDDLRNGMLQLIRQGMLNDVYATGKVSRVSFIGTRADTGGVSTTEDRSIAFNTDSGDESGLTAVGTTFIAIGSLLFLSLLALFVKRRRRHNDEKYLVFVDATIASRELVSTDSDEGPKKRSTAGYSFREDGANAPGSLAADDSLALQPQIVAKDLDEVQDDADTSVHSRTTATFSCSPNSKADPDILNDSLDTSGAIDDDNLIIDTSSLDGANEDAILHRLHDIAETGEEPMDSATDDDDSVHRPRRFHN